MPRMVAPQPHAEFNVKLKKPFTGASTHTVEITGEPNRTANIKTTTHHGGNSKEKLGTMSSDDVQELLSLVSQLRGFPSNETEDIYGLDAVIELQTFEIAWTNQETDPAADVVNEVSNETQSTFKDVVDSIEAAGRAFAKKDNPL
ncbi:hypothetical protein CC78DRAFT_564772 [Lojkania enalia]|uniref:Uncharacterized protein n=1 Tax=Lojkania enalia TaxID=147567 RepID=A0A9P4NAA8_9PLEO|nr:hypothetical protein CC78DRAFT_564772 [Didymosphaeria enalia]